MPKSDKRKLSVEEAKEQSAEYFGFAASVTIRTDNGDFEIPNPGLLDDDQQERYDELQTEIDTYDKEDVVTPVFDTEVVRDPDGTIRTSNKKVGEKIDQVVLLPHRKDGVVVKPPYNVRLAIALWGEERYAKFKTGGGQSSQISLEWARMNREYQERLESDPKSDSPSTSG
jgi:hypothetical protein